jgi:hypothetical protein
MSPNCYIVTIGFSRKAEKINGEVSALS